MNLKTNKIMKNIHKIRENIYITSDEEIKDVRPHKGKWQLETGQILNKFPSYLTDLSECKLVIMTTDQDLIRDGVQAVEEDFLNWFVKNPSCEEVDINIDFGVGLDISINFYKIIIPKEELLGKTISKKDADKDSYVTNYITEKIYSEKEVILLLQKALTHQDNGEIGSLVTAQGEIRPANFFSWFERFKNK